VIDDHEHERDEQGDKQPAEEIVDLPPIPPKNG